MNLSNNFLTHLKTNNRLHLCVCIWEALQTTHSLLGVGIDLGPRALQQVPLQLSHLIGPHFAFPTRLV